MTTLLLFDVDLTLIKTGGAGLRAMEEAFLTYAGVGGPLTMPQPDGQTDPVIVERLFTLNGVGYEAARDYDAFLLTYFAALEREAARAEEWVMLPGVGTLIPLLAGMDEFRLGLLTGNDERGARLKLSPYDLNRYFPIGGYGNDSPWRHELIPKAIARAEVHYGVEFPTERVITIGDSIYDVLAAKKAGIHCLGVLTGRTSAEAMREVGAKHLLPDLSDAQAVLTALRAIVA